MSVSGHSRSPIESANANGNCFLFAITSLCLKIGRWPTMAVFCLTTAWRCWRTKLVHFITPITIGDMSNLNKIGSTGVSVGKVKYKLFMWFFNFPLFPSIATSVPENGDSFPFGSFTNLTIWWLVPTTLSPGFSKNSHVITKYWKLLDSIFNSHRISANLTAGSYWSWLGVQTHYQLRPLFSQLKSDERGIEVIMWNINFWRDFPVFSFTPNIDHKTLNDFWYFRIIQRRLVLHMTNIVGYCVNFRWSFTRNTPLLRYSFQFATSAQSSLQGIEQVLNRMLCIMAKRRRLLQRIVYRVLNFRCSLKGSWNFWGTLRKKKNQNLAIFKVLKFAENTSNDMIWWYKYDILKVVWPKKLNTRCTIYPKLKKLIFEA